MDKCDLVVLQTTDFYKTLPNITLFIVEFYGLKISGPYRYKIRETQNK